MLGGSDLITSPSSYIEKHKLTGSDDVLQFAVGTNVILQIEQPQQDKNLRLRDSVRASTQILTEYKWESKTNYTGRILSSNDKLIAYRLFNETTGEAVRVLEREQRFRHLIKDFQHPTVDLQWAIHAPLLAVLDSNANIYIYMVDNNGEKLSKYLIIIQEGDHTNKGPARLVWCPYISDDGSEPGEHEDIHLLGVVQGQQVNLFMLNKIREEIGRTEVTYERIRELKGVMTSVQIESEITACKISPDATALVVAGSDGELAFFVIEQFDDDIQIASNCRPLANNPIEELIFLDSLWKTVVLSSDNGRRLALFDCDHWQCMAKLRFESPNQVTRMELLAEPNMHFLFVADYDLSNLFCIELSQPVLQPSGKFGPLCFAACTQISFCNPLICIVPCSLTDHSADLSLEDEDQLLGGDNNSGTTPSTIATLVAITQRSLLEINVELDRVFNVDPSVASAIPISTSQQSSRSHHNIIHPTYISTHSVENTATENLQQQQTTQQLLEEFIDPNNLAKNSQSLSLQNTNRSVRQSSADNIGSSNNKSFGCIDGVNGNNYRSEWQQPPPNINEEFVEKMNETIERRFGEFGEKIDDLSHQLSKLQVENEHLRANQADNLSNVLEKISNELKSREDRMEALVIKQYNEGAEQIVRSTEALLANHSENLQRNMDFAQRRSSEQIHLSLERILVPQVEVVCTQLFHQLNESFRSGLQEFIEQLKTLSKQQLEQVKVAAQQQQQHYQQQQQQQSEPQLTSMERLNRLLNANKLKDAFELALNHDDSATPGSDLLLPVVCKRVDPDTFFSTSSSSAAAVSPSSANSSTTSIPPPPLPIGAIYQLLLQLAARLETDTDLKFRYLENALPALNNVLLFGRQSTTSSTPGRSTKEQKGSGAKQNTLDLRGVMERLGQALYAFGEKEENREWKRRIRLLNQLIANMLTVNASH
ncbi:hypothetical protein ACQ4LE_006853 [Meloidogyne hapla]|uniref:Ge1_WD40 domain-containing protein n=1 Tax=Meloidogyne hapla TaxID=6305 RepID=A0A1I8BZ47_MELHA